VAAFSHKLSIARSGETSDRIKKVRGAKMPRTFSITVPSIVRIVGRAPGVDEKVMLFCLSVTGTPTQWSKMGFSPGRGDTLPP